MGKILTEQIEVIYFLLECDRFFLGGMNRKEAAREQEEQMTYNL